MIAGVVAVSMTMSFTTPSRAQESPAESGEIRNGTAKAAAKIARYAPGVGELELGMTNGIAVSQVTNFLAQATSQTTDLGLIGTALTADSCDGSQYVRPSDLPQATSVDNRDGDTSATRDESRTDGSPSGFGRMTVAANEEPPEAVSAVTGSQTALSPLLRFDGGEARAEARVLPGEGREALARTQGSLDLGNGALVMSGMVWRAYHRTGVDPLAEASFSIGTSNFGGYESDSDNTESFEAAAAQALAPLGITITFPRVERLTDPADLIRVTPMRIEMRDSPAGRAVFGPILDATRTPRGQLYDSIVEYFCDSRSALLVADVVVTVISGTGFLVVEFGGVEAGSQDLELFDPFEDFTPGVPTAPSSTAPAPPTTRATQVSGVPATRPPTTATPATPAVSTVIDNGSDEIAVPAPENVAFETVCESVHPNRSPDCSTGSAALVGVLALLATLGVGGADLLRQRRLGVSETTS